METILQSDSNISLRMEAFNSQLDAWFETCSIRTMTSFASFRSSRASFERTLAKARVYQKALRNLSTSTLRTTGTSESRWSQLSGLSLSQISSIVVFCLPLCTHDLANCFLLNQMKAQPDDGRTTLHEEAYRGRWVAGGSSAILPARPEAEGGFLGSVIL